MISSSVSNLFTFSFTILDLLDPIASPMCLTRISDQNMFYSVNDLFTFFRFASLVSKFCPLKATARRKMSESVISQFLPFLWFHDVFATFLPLSDKSQESTWYSIYSTFQKLQFERKRSLLAQCVQKL